MTPIAGDVPGTAVTFEGTSSRWLTVRVEDTSSFLAVESLTVQLDSPPNVNFDLFLYVNESIAAPECTTVHAQSTRTTGPDTATASWDDNPWLSDSRTVTIEVRHLTGACTGAPWKLTLTSST